MGSKSYSKYRMIWNNGRKLTIVSKSGRLLFKEDDLLKRISTDKTGQFKLSCRWFNKCLDSLWCDRPVFKKVTQWHQSSSLNPIRTSIKSFLSSFDFRKNWISIKKVKIWPFTYTINYLHWFVRILQCYNFLQILIPF